MAENWDLLLNDWDTLTGWTKAGTGTSELDPLGALHQLAGALTSVERTKTLAGGLPSQYTVEFRMKLENNAYRKSYNFYDGVHIMNLSISSIQIFFTKTLGTDAYFLATTIGTYYTWRLLCDTANDTLTVYRNNLLITSFTNPFTSALNDGKVVTRDSFSQESREDHLKIRSGLHVPPAENYTNEGTCEQYGYYWYRSACHSTPQEAREARADKIKDLQEKYGMGPYNPTVRGLYADCFGEVRSYDDDEGTWVSRSSKRRRRGVRSKV